MLYLPALVPLALVVACLVHVFRTGRDRFWIYIIIFLPMAGCIAYFFVEVLPDLIQGRGAARLSAGVVRAVSPGRKLKEREAALDLAPTVENRIALAEAWTEEGDPAKAADLYAACLNGVYKEDKMILSRLAHSLQAAGYSVRARQVFDELVRIHGPLTDDRDLLCFASTLDACGETAKAEEHYRAAAAKSPSLEARYRYAAFLRSAGRTEEAAREVTSLERGFALMPGFAKRTQRKWVQAARKELG